MKLSWLSLFFCLNGSFGRQEKIDIKNKTTNIGPHRDDLEFLIDKTNLRTYGSQGQQRIAVIALKLSEIEIFKQYKNRWKL